MKKKLIILIVITILLLPSTMIIAGKPSDLSDQTQRNGPKDDIKEFLYDLFQEIASRMYQKKGWVPQGIIGVLSGLGR